LQAQLLSQFAIQKLRNKSAAFYYATAGMMHHLRSSSAPAAAAVAPALLLLLLLLAVPGGASDTFEVTDSPTAAGAYFVVLKDAPSATYRGDISGFEATQVQQASVTSDSAAVRKLDVSSAAVVAYAAFLEAQSASVAAAADVAAEDLLYTYKHVLAGFAVRVTSARQLAALRRDRRVAAVEAVKWMQAYTFTTPGFLGLEGNSSSSSSGGGGAWDQVGGVTRAGEDVSICVVDTGIEPEHPSFSDRQNTSSDTGPYAYAASNSALYQGSCPVGEEFPAGTCK
jgi:subtilisin family serine protease